MTNRFIKHIFCICLFALFISASIDVYAEREKISFDHGWMLAFGNASSPQEDFGCGTEYFNYLTKASSIHNEGPYALKFDPEKWGKEWKKVDLPHDWVVDLPFANYASHSHGYKTVGYKFPETSVGWYRKTFYIPKEDYGRHISLQFDGIFRNATVWVNGFYLGNEPSGYATQIYDISEYLNYGGENVVAVRVDASLEEGWFYEGAGIYRHAWLNKSNPLHVAPFGVYAYAPDMMPPYESATLAIETTVRNDGNEGSAYGLKHYLYDHTGKLINTSSEETGNVSAKSDEKSKTTIYIQNPDLWSPDTPVLYTVKTEVMADGNVVDTYYTKCGIRDVKFDAENGFSINGKNLKLKGVNMHQDHPGVGSAIPDALQTYRLLQLKKMGVNAYRSSHNPMTPEMLDACDSLGILVVEENRLLGINDEHLTLLEKMIRRDRNHPSIILWSVGNEEWGIEWDEKGTRLAESLCEYCHKYDPQRQMCVATSGGPSIVIPVDVAGYNYLLQNPIDEHRKNYPQRIAIGSEETSGCGTRGVYYDDHSNGRMIAINRTKSGSDSLYNAIERGWKFYDERPWLGGLFYWTGFDYRGEPNPMAFPATGSQFGILDYCGFPKDEAYYLKSVWTDLPVLHIFPHWNLKGHEGENVDIWAYSNCDEVELIVNGKNLGRKQMPKNGHLSWMAEYNPGYVKAIGYKNKKKILEQKIETTDAPYKLNISADRNIISADNRDVAVVTVEVRDKKNRFVPDGNVNLEVSISGEGRILGFGNGDPAYQGVERASGNSCHVNTFNGLAQILIQSTETPGNITLSVSSDGLKSSSIAMDTK